jgi:DnaA family protein
MNAQMPLPLRWPARQRFDSFVVGANGAAVAMLREAAAIGAARPWVFVSGAAASGKTHLLIAACADASAAGRSAQYLSLARLPDRTAAIRAFGGSELLTIDDVQALAGDAASEHALFDLYNRSRMANATMLFAAPAPPAQIGIGLPDLVSRLSACAQARLIALDDVARRHWLRERALARGMTLDDVVLDWLFAHHARDLGSLSEMLDRIDRAALAAQRRLTLPFVRGVLASDHDGGKIAP